MSLNLANVTANHSKEAAVVATALTGFSSVDVWILQTLPELLSVIALIFSLALSATLIRYHLLNTKKIKLENEAKQLEIISLKIRLEKERLDDGVTNIQNAS